MKLYTQQELKRVLKYMKLENRFQLLTGNVSVPWEHRSTCSPAWKGRCSSKCRSRGGSRSRTGSRCVGRRTPRRRRSWAPSPCPSSLRGSGSVTRHVKNKYEILIYSCWVNFSFCISQESEGEVRRWPWCRWCWSLPYTTS